MLSINKIEIIDFIDLRVIQGRGSGPVLVEVRGTRIALGHGLASQVIVEVVEDST